MNVAVATRDDVAVVRRRGRGSLLTVMWWSTRARKIWETERVLRPASDESAGGLGRWSGLCGRRAGLQRKEETGHRLWLKTTSDGVLDMIADRQSRDEDQDEHFSKTWMAETIESER